MSSSGSGVIKREALKELKRALRKGTTEEVLSVFPLSLCSEGGKRLLQTKNATKKGDIGT